MNCFIGVVLISFAPPLVLAVASSLADFFFAPEVVQPLSAFVQDLSLFWGAAIGSTIIRSLLLTAIWLLFHATAVRWRWRSVLRVAGKITPARRS
jgi:hypothetical protein